MSSEITKPPKWLDEKLFESIIEKELNLDKSKFVLKIISLKPAVADGENYISMVYRVGLEVKITGDLTKSYSFIIKSNMPGIKMLEELQIFEKEMIFFDEIVPKIHECFGAIEFGPKCYMTSYKSTKLIILEDLSVSGYRLQNRHAGLDLEHSKLYCKKIAEFHSLTALYHEKFGEFEKPLNATYFNLETKHIFEMSAFKHINEFLAIFERYEELRPYQSKMLKYQDDLFDTLFSTMSPKPNEFAVLNHGDSWLNNMLFRYDDNNNPIDIRLIDFQIINFTTPLLDLIYFFVTSTTNEVRENHFDDLLHLYHDHLTENLLKLSYSKQIPTLRDLQKEFLQKGFVAVYFIATVLPIVLIDSKDVDEDKGKMFEDSKENSSRSYNMFNNPRYIKAVATTFKFLDYRGLLEKA